MCYNCVDFKKVMHDNNWTEKTLPANVACIEICCTSDITEYYGSTFRLADKPYFYGKHSNENTLVLFFDDITEDVRDITSKIHAKGFTIEQARQLIAFIDKNINKDFYIRCHAGKSRSQAVVQYILDFYSSIDWETNKDNPCVYDLINVRVFSALKNLKLGYIK